MHMRRARDQRPNRPILRPCQVSRMSMLGIMGIVGTLFALTVLPRVVTAASSVGSSIPPPLPGAILLEGKAIPFLHGQPLVAIQVFAFRSHTLTPIPFQIDERDRRGRWVITAGPRPSRDNKPDIFDANDALIFLSRDLGAQTAVDTFPQAPSVWHEIRLGPPTSPFGFVYIGLGEALARSDAPPRVRYMPDQDRVYTERYTLEFGAPLPTHLAFVSALGDFGQNTIAGIRIAGEIRFLDGLLRVRRTDQDLQSRLYGYRQGPVRIIRRAQYWFPLPFGLRATGRIDLIFYPDCVEGTALVKLKIPPRFVLADGELSVYFDFLNFSGARVLLASSASRQPGNSRMAQAQQALTQQPARWAALLLPTGQTLLLITRLEGKLQQLDQRVYFEDRTQPVGGQSVGGQPAFGFHFSKLSRLDAGTYRLSIFGVLLNTTDSEDIQSAAAFFLSPPAVTVSRLK